MRIHCAGTGSTAICGADFKAADEFIYHWHTALYSLVLERSLTPAECGINCPDCLNLLGTAA